MSTDELDPKEKPKRRARIGFWIGVVFLVIVIVVAAAGVIAIRRAEDGNLANGRATVDKSDWAAAVEALDKVLETQPAFIRQHVIEATALRGLAHYKQGDIDAALTDFDAVLAANPNLVDLKAYRANIYYRQRNYEAAHDEGESALENEQLLPEHLVAMIHADRAAIAQASNQDDAFINESDAALASGHYLPDETIADLYAGRAIKAFDDGDSEQILSESMVALDYESVLADSIQAEILTNMAALYYQEGLIDLALETSDSALAFEALPEDRQADLLLMRAGVRFKQDDLITAIDEAEEAAKLGEDQAMLHALQALQYYQDGDEAEALTEANAALAIEDDALAYRVRGSVYAWQGKIEQALADLDQALALDETDVEGLAMRVYSYLELNDLEAAEADLDRAQQLNDVAPSTLWAEALVAHYVYDFDRARALMDLAIELDGSRPEFYTLRATTYRFTDEQTLAMEDTQQALSLNEDFPLALLNRMALNAERFDYDTYEENATQLIELYPDWYLGHDALAWYHHAILHDPDKARSYADKIVELRPESTVGYLRRGGIHLENEEYDLAQTDFEKAQELRPNSLEVIEALAYLNWYQDETDLALQGFDQILEVLPDNTATLLNQASIYIELGQLEDSWQKVHEALAYDPEDPQALVMRAQLNMETGELDEAHVDLLRVVDEYPKYPLAHLTQARAYYFQGRFDEAREAAMRTLAIDPSLTHANWLLMSIALTEEDADEAEDQINSWIEAEPESAAAHYWLGGVYNFQGKDEEAVEILSEALLLAEEDNPFRGDIYHERAIAYLGGSEEELAEADLLATIENTTNLDLIDSSEAILIDPGLMAISIGGRRVVEDLGAGYKISFDEKWVQYPADPDEGYFLSLGSGEEELEASVDVFIIYDWDPQFSVYDLAAVIDPAADGAVSGPLETVQISGQGGLKRDFEQEEMGNLVRGRQYIVTQGNRAALILVWVLDTVAEEFEMEFEAIAESFEFLPQN